MDDRSHLRALLLLHGWNCWKDEPANQQRCRFRAWIHSIACNGRRYCFLLHDSRPRDLTDGIDFDSA